MSRAVTKKNPSLKIHATIIAAAIGAAAAIIVAVINIIPQATRGTPVLDAQEVAGWGRLVGTLTDLSGKPISDMLVSIRNGPEARTDTYGNFTLNGTPVGDQQIVVKAPLRSGTLTQNIHVEREQTTRANIIYNAESSRLGMLSIVAPVDSGELEVEADGTVHRATIYGRCDGLYQVLSESDIWVLVRAQDDTKFWVQHPPTAIDWNTNT